MSLKIRVRNFQSVKDAEIVVDGLTVITGTNNAGKSAFFRAIRGAFTNARGFDFVRFGESHCRVDILFEDGRTLTWEKGKNTNTYIINGNALPKVGQGVPPEAQIFGVEPVMAGKMELWPQIAPQITGVSFLLHEPGSVIAEAVADVSRVNQLSRALKACDSDRRSVRADLKIRKADGSVFAERREGFAGLDRVVEKVAALEEQQKKADKITKALGNLTKLQRRHHAAQEAVTVLNGLEIVESALPTGSAIDKGKGCSKDLQEASNLQHRYRSAKLEATALEGLETVQDALPSEARLTYAQRFRKGVQVTVELTARFQDAQRDLKIAERAHFVLGKVSLDDGNIIRAQKFKKALGNAQGLKDKYLKNRTAVDILTQQIDAQQRELDTLTEKISSVLGTYEECPTCGGGLDHVH